MMVPPLAALLSTRERNDAYRAKSLALALVKDNYGSACTLWSGSQLLNGAFRLFLT